MRGKLVVPCLCFFATLMAAIPTLGKPTKNETEKAHRERLVTSLQGIWEQTGRWDHKGKLEETDPKGYRILRCVKVIKGSSVYTIRNFGLSIYADRLEFSVGNSTDPGAIDFLDPENNFTIRSRSELKENTLSICMHGGNATLRRPEKITPTEDGFVVEAYRRLASPKNQAGTGKTPPITGIWSAFEIELDGKKIDGKKLPVDTRWEFAENSKAFCFLGDVYVMISSSEGLQTLVTHGKLEFVPNSDNAINFKREDGRIVQGIYELKGDHLTLCWSSAGENRPNQFRTQDGDRWELVRLKRVDLEKKP